MFNTKPNTPDKEAQAITLANQRYVTADKFWGPFFAKAQIELGFLQGDKQWDAQTRAFREQEGRPTLTLNRVSTFIRNLEARNRNNVLQLSAVPETGLGENNAEVVTAILKRIASESGLETILDQSSKYQISTGIGYVRVFPDYPHQYSFDQDLRLEAIADPATVLYDPAAKGFLFEDANYCFVITRMRKEEYLATIGKNSKIAEEVQVSKFSRKVSPMVVDSETIVVAEYYRKEPVDIVLQKYVDTADQSVQIIEKGSKKELPDSWLLVNERKLTKYKILHSLFDGVEFHNTTELQGLDRIPVIPMIGEDCTVDGKREFWGAIRQAMDAQKLLNYTVSISLEVADLQAKSPWVVEDDSIKGYEDIWRVANTSNFSYLPYKRGTQPPSRNSVDTNITALMSLKTESANDLQAIFGVFDTQLGDDGNAVSGVAIDSRNDSAQKSVYVYKDNMIKTAKEVCRVLIGMIPTYYNGRPIEVQTALGSSKKVQCDIPETAWFKSEVSEAPSDLTQKQKVNTQLLEISKALPSVAPALVDAIVKNSDIPGQEEIVARLQALLPPEIQAVQKQVQDMSESDLRAAVAAGSAQMQQAQQQLVQAQQQAQALELENKTLKADRSIEQAKLELDRQKAEMDYDLAQKELLVKQAELEVTSNIEFHKISQAQEKLTLEASGIQTDEIDY